MATVGSYEAKSHLSQLLTRVANGEQITITRHGVPVAVLAPPPPAPTEDVGEVIRRIKEFRQGNALGDTTVRELIDEGRRF